MYIAFEGIDTVGKSTQIERLAKHFPDVLVTREPGGTELGKKIRTILLEEGNISARSEILLFLADRAEHTETLIRPNLERMIFSDRSFLSGIAYAHVHEGVAVDILLQLNRFATDNLFPDRIILFTIDEGSLRSRLGGKTGDAIEMRGIRYMMEVQKTMEELVDLLGIEYILVDATAPVDTITRQLIDYINQG
ncbi:dTMP kinase [Hydrogenimonas cancrithermarum]|uniref:Thymidylate kinase n=1 Tax=Hydrogenimonas cancrithermarum TaxID=2993563 RepID=A0ABM8FKH7_9BACT|nr:dTMP kinase [Hydrogenimonas cancrithermarum]BDY12186.1 thymidylate kinase [Hydrogenimonas cancrithermarum]